MKVKYILIILIVLFLISCDNLSINTKYTYEDSAYYNVGNASFDYSIIKSIDIDWISGNVYIEKSPENDNLVTFYEIIDSNTSDELKMHYYLKDGTLKIRFAKSTPSLVHNFKSKELHIRIPNDLALDEFKTNAIDSSLYIELLTAKKCHFDTISGNININNLETSNMIIESVSGNINISKSNLSFTTIESTSGLIAINNSICDNTKIETVSGDITFSLFQGNSLDIESTSSTINLNYLNIPNSISINSISSNVFIYLPKDSTFIVETDVVSKDFFYDFILDNNDNIYTCGDNPLLNIKVFKTSGNLIIKKN